MGTDQIMYCIVALILGMLMFHMLKNVCGCKTVEGNSTGTPAPTNERGVHLDHNGSVDQSCMGDNVPLNKYDNPKCGCTNTPYGVGCECDSTSDCKTHPNDEAFPDGMGTCMQYSDKDVKICH